MHINSERNSEQRIKHRAEGERFPDVFPGRGFEIKCLPEQLEIMSRLKRAVLQGMKQSSSCVFTINIVLMVNLFSKLIDISDVHSNNHKVFKY